MHLHLVARDCSLLLLLLCLRTRLCVRQTSGTCAITPFAEQSQSVSFRILSLLSPIKVMLEFLGLGSALVPDSFLRPKPLKTWPNNMTITENGLDGVLAFATWLNERVCDAERDVLMPVS